MSRVALRAFAGRSADALEAFLASEVIALVPVAGLRPAKAVRGAAQVRLADGRVLKVRRMADAAHAASVARLLEELADPRLPRPLFVHDVILVEPWVEGVVLSEVGATGAEARALGSLLGALHARPHALGHALPRAGTTSHRRARLARHLEDLLRGEHLDAATAGEVSARAAALDPGTAEFGLIHRDLCPENVVRTPWGELVVVDNEGLSIAPLDGDLARTWTRWPMDAATRAAFLSGYAAHRDPATAVRNERFWRLVTLVKSLHVRAVRLGVDASAPRSDLHALLGRVRPPAGEPGPTEGRS